MEPSGSWRSPLPQSRIVFTPNGFAAFSSWLWRSCGRTANWRASAYSLNSSRATIWPKSASPMASWREARILARLEHPGIVPIHDVGVLPDGRPYYTMKLVEGRRLDEYLHGRPALAELCRVFLRVCEPLAFAHARGVVHRDLKPENI